MSHEKTETDRFFTLSPCGGGPRVARGGGAKAQPQPPTHIPKRLDVWIFRRSDAAALILAASLLAAPPVHAQTTPLTPTQQQQVQRVGEGLRCPICRDTLPITESGNDISKGMLREIAVQAAAGKSDEEIYQFFTSRYGERIRLNPERSGTNLLLWGLPLLALLGGGVWLASYLRGRPAPTGPEPDPILDEAPDPYLAEIRERVQKEQQ